MKKFYSIYAQTTRSGTEREGGNGMKLEQNGTDQNTHTERFTSERNRTRGREGGRESFSLSLHALTERNGS